MKILWITALIVFLSLGAVYLYARQKENDIQKKLTYLALGDSYTIGEAVAENDRWPIQLAEKMNSEGFHIEDPVIVAKTGWTTGELLKGISDSGVSGTYDLVSLLIGVNNQYRGLNVEDYRKELRQCLDTAVKFAGNNPQKVFVVSIPDWGVMPFAENRDRKKIAAEIDRFNAIKQEECSKMGILFIDITDISREAAFKHEYVASDGLHPSGIMYSKWVERILPEILNTILKGSVQ